MDMESETETDWESVFRVGLSEWHQELELALLHLDDAKIECLDMSMTISRLLTDAGIWHTVKTGTAIHNQNGDWVIPHTWIELEDGCVIDFRLRMWLGDYDSIPHGIFMPGAAAMIIKYVETNTSKSYNISRSDLDEITDYRFGKIRIPQKY